jgi:hypothetical protein
LPHSRSVYAARRLVSDEPNQTHRTEALGLSRHNLSDFLLLNSLKSLLGEGYADTMFEREEIEIESESGSQRESRFLSVPPKIANAYWLWQAHRGKKATLTLCMGPITEFLERRFDEAFGITCTLTGGKRIASTS